jgi:hypothetical protein
MFVARTTSIGLGSFLIPVPGNVTSMPTKTPVR